VAVLLISVSVRHASADGVGGTISLGAIGGTTTAPTVEVNTTAPNVADGWSGFNVHVGSLASSGVTLGSITAVIGTGLTGSVFCPALSTPAAGEAIYACTSIAGQFITSAGQLAVFTFNATGNGCIQVKLFHVPGDANLDTYTVDANTSSIQAVVVSTISAKLPVGTGTLADCGAIPTATPTVPPTNTAVHTATPTFTATSTPPTSMSTPVPTSTVPPPPKGIGGTISFGAVGGTSSAPSVSVDTTAATDGWSGFSIHIGYAASAGVTPGNVAEVPGTGLPGSTFCVPTTPATSEVIFGCVGLAGQSVTAAGQLAVFTFEASGSGCIRLTLIHVAGNSILDTFTIDAKTTSVQINVVSAATAYLPVGTGTVDDCTVIPTATSTPQTPTVTATATPTDTPTATPCADVCPTPAATNTPSGGYPAPTGNCALAMTATALVGTQTPILVTVLDANGAPVAGATVDFSIVTQPGTDATVTADASLTDALGVVTGTVSVGTAPGVVQILATAPTVSCGGSIVVSTG
jgi:hypothetical protein